MTRQQPENCPPETPPNDDGYATILSASAAAALTALAIAAATIISHIANTHKAQLAADLAATAAAHAHISGQDGCRRAATVAERNKAQLDTCAPQGDDITCTVITRTQFASATATATAGPDTEGADAVGRMPRG